MRTLFKSLCLVIATANFWVRQVYALTGTGWGQWILLCNCHYHSSSSFNTTRATNLSEPLYLDGEELEVIAIKIGGSSLTDKANLETINPEALEWFSQTIFESIHEAFTYSSSKHIQDESYILDRRRRAYVIVHGAGSFGHHTAKEYNLEGKSTAPSLNDLPREGGDDSYQIRRKKMHGLAQTRQSVQTLNRLLVGSLIKTGVNAVAISPCFGIPKMQAHGGDETVRSHLETVLRDALTSGLVPVLHGDACLYGERNAGILSGDVLMETLGLLPWVSRVVFLTDVDGVFSSDPRRDTGAKLLPEIEIDRDTLQVISPVLNVSRSTHEHDVTGGFETKLASAINIAASRKNVTIARCCSKSGEDAIRQETIIPRTTLVYSSSRDSARQTNP